MDFSNYAWRVDPSGVIFNDDDYGGVDYSYGRKRSPVTYDYDGIAWGVRSDGGLGGDYGVDYSYGTSISGHGKY